MAFFTNTTSNGPAGLLSITSTAGDAFGDLDWAEQAKSNAEQANTTVDAFVCSPATAVTIATLNEYSTAGSNKALLASDPTAPASRVVAGVPLLTSPAIADNIIWAVPKNRIVVALRQGTEVVTDTSAFFTSHRVAVRAVLRIGWEFTHEAAISKVTISP